MPLICDICADAYVRIPQRPLRRAFFRGFVPVCDRLVAVIRSFGNSTVALAASLLCSGLAGAQTTPWQNDWTVQKAPSLQLLQYSAYYESALQSLQAPVVMSPMATF